MKKQILFFLIFSAEVSLYCSDSVSFYNERETGTLSQDEILQNRSDLREAIKSGNTSLALRLIPLSDVGTYYGPEEALIYKAIEYDNEPVVWALINEGASLEIKNRFKQNETPLEVAQRMGNFSIINFLQQKINERNQKVNRSNRKFNKYNQGFFNHRGWIR